MVSKALNTIVNRAAGRMGPIVLVLGLGLFLPFTAPTISAATPPAAAATTVSGDIRVPAEAARPDTNSPADATVISVLGAVEYSRKGTGVWLPATPQLALNAGDALRTAEFSRATLLLRSRTVLQVSELTSIRVAPDRESLLLQLLRGFLYFFHRDDTTPLEVEASGINAAVLGTDVAFGTGTDGTVSVSLYDGRVFVRMASGNAELKSGEQAIIRPGEPVRAVPLQARDFSAVQWFLNSPLLLVPDDLGWREAPDPSLASSLDAFRSGSAARAFAAYPPGRSPGSAGETVYLAALHLAVGDVPGAKRWLDQVPPDTLPGGIAAILRQWIAAMVHGEPIPSTCPTTSPATATEHLAASYHLQSATRLAEALEQARAATERAPDFGPAWARRAELAFTLGRTREARAHLDRCLALSPDHAPAWTLLGFVHAAGNRTAPALVAFERAIALDPTLADAWLGRGLCRIRRGDLENGRTDLLIAAAREPHRSLPRSYLGKAFADAPPFHAAFLKELALHEWTLARQLDPADPTPWLYSALLHQQENRINTAIDDLHQSRRLNDQRAIFRSRLGLDQDRAVRSANLAQLYRDAGFPDIALREASHALDADYANAAAHLFLANSYDLRRDPRRVHLRYETPWYSAFLLANLLAPVGAGSLSQTVANQEYSRLLQRDRLGFASSTSWTSNGDWLQRAAQFGQEGNLAYSLDALYASRSGERSNHDSEELALSATVKVQAGTSDDLLIQTAYFDAESGDLLRRYDPSDALPGLRIEERHEPTAQLGWHRTWSPGHHTLALVSPWNVTLNYRNPDHRVPYAFEDDTGAASWNLGALPLESYQSRLTGVAAEVQHLWQSDFHTVVAGGRIQSGGFDTTAQLNPTEFSDDIDPASRADPRMQRLGLYAYDQWRPVDAVSLTAGVSYDHLVQPVNFRSAPVVDGTRTRDLLGPKLGLTVRPWTGGVLRAGWSRNLGGVSLDQSQRLEPVQIAGFTQAYRGLLPESLTGSVSGQSMEVLGIAWDQVFPTRTWITLSLERLTSDADQVAGGYRFTPSGFQGVETFTEALDFTEDSLLFTVGQVLSRDLSAAVRYRVADAELTRTPQPGFVNLEDATRERSIAHQMTASLRYHHPSGFFASVDATWTQQSNRLGSGRHEDDDFWHEDLWVGWRFARRQAELALGILNLTGTDYRLHPLNDLPEPYRDRTLAVTGRFAF